LIGAAALTAAFVATSSAGMPVNTRYLLPQAVVVSLAWALALAGWRTPGLDTGIRRTWIVIAGCVAALTLGLAPGHIRLLGRTQDAVSQEARSAEDLRALARPGGPLHATTSAMERGGCPLVVGTTSHRRVPLLLLWSGMSSSERVPNDGAVYALQRRTEPVQPLLVTGAQADVTSGDGTVGGDPAESDDPLESGWQVVDVSGAWALMAAQACTP
jgi:hypothetical protein